MPQAVIAYRIHGRSQPNADTRDTIQHKQHSIANYCHLQKHSSAKPQKEIGLQQPTNVTISIIVQLCHGWPWQYGPADATATHCLLLQ